MAKQKDDQHGGNAAAQRPESDPPPFQPKLQIAPLQLIGIPLLALISLLALFGLFDQATATVEAANQELVLRVDYVARHRYKLLEEIDVAVTNVSAQSSATITVAFGRAYLDDFSEVSFVPDIGIITADAFLVEVANVERSETRLVAVEMRGEGSWRHTGIISASLAGGQPLSVTVNTFVFP